MDQDKYQAAGIDFARGLERFMGNTELYKKFLTKFLYDGSFAEFCVGIERRYVYGRKCGTYIEGDGW